uniref:NADH dehydrogenase subunit 6 n=1 Tax=Blattisocius keegani TaxID=2337216 RepID=A0A4Y5QD95_9ACAR|nr:NADH dehydrogenase subunit 6 [Blattisocius keegani]
MMTLKLTYFMFLSMFITSTNLMYKIYYLILFIITSNFWLSLMIKSSWFFLIFCILMISGLFTLITYMLTISNNNMHKSKFINNIMLLMIVFYWMKLFSNNFQNTPMTEYFENYYVNIFHLFNNSSWILILITYLMIKMFIYLELINNFHTFLRINYMI